MQSSSISAIFAFAVVASLLVKFWLASRQMRHVALHRNDIPQAFLATVTLEGHRRAAAYTLERTRFGLLTEALSAALLLGWTLLGGLEALNGTLLNVLWPRFGDLGYQLALMAAFVLIGSLLELPMDLVRVFRIEQRFGFNRMSLRLYLADQLKGALVGALIGLPLLALVLWIMSAAGGWWWLWAWAAWTGFVLLIQWLYPTVIAPLFNKFQPLPDLALAARVQALMERCGFQSSGLFVMDGSRRSAHGNAFFTGMGRSKRVVFFDTLLARLAPAEVEAVLAHELGHFHHRHVTKRMVLMFATSLAGLALLGWLAQQPAFYLGLGVRPSLEAPNDALALLLFVMAAPPFMFFVSPLASLYSRKAEFQADAYACQQTRGSDLAAALLKLYEDNASTLTPDPLYARFYYSHPPASERLAALALAAP
jgi:STE24 endopeptidase